MNKQQKAALLTALADYIASEGCTCCQDIPKHDDAANRLGELLGVPKFADGSGYDFWQFRSDQ